MDCNLLDANIGSCVTPSFKGFKRTGWFTMLSNIDKASIVKSGATVKFNLKGGMFYEIYDDSVNPFMGSGATVETSSNHGYKFFNPTVKFPLKPLSPAYSAMVAAIKDGAEMVVVLEQEEKGTDDTSRYVVFGLDSGLYCTTPSYELANDSVWEIELVETRADLPCMFLYDTDLADTTALAERLLQCYWISGLTIGDGTVTPKTVNLFIDIDLNGYVIFPDNSIASTTLGEIVETWNGEAGDILIIVDKDVANFDVNNTDYIGEVKFNNTINLISCDINTCNNITLLDVSSVNTIAYSSGLTQAGQKLILDNAYTLYLSGVEDGVIDTSGVPGEIDPADISAVHSLSYDDMMTAMTGAGWTITISTL